MYVKRNVVECDFTDRTYDRGVPGCAAIARGATGRWCEVMWMGPEYMAENNVEAKEYDEAVAWLKENYPNDRIDF